MTGWDVTQKPEPPYYLMAYPVGGGYCICLTFADGQTIHQTVTKEMLDQTPVGFWIDTFMRRKKTPQA